MAKKRLQLTVKALERAKAKDKPYRLSDGEGLYLLVRTSGVKYWECRYTNPHTCKRTFFGLGGFPEMTLVEARQKALEVNKLVAEGIDPKLHRDKKKLENKFNMVNTLEVVAGLWLEKKSQQVTPDYAEDILGSLRLHVFPSLGKLPITEITAPHTIQILRPLEKQQKLETIKRVNQRLNEIMQFAVNIGMLHSNSLAGIKAAFDKPKKVHNPCLKPEELPELMTTLATSNTKATA